jgi:hypothetical protein
VRCVWMGICCTCANTSRKRQRHHDYIQHGSILGQSPKSHQSAPGHSSTRASPKSGQKKKSKHPRATTDDNRGLVATQMFRLTHTRPHRHPSLRQLPPWRKCLASQSVGGPYQAKSSHPSASSGAGQSHGSGCLPSPRQSQNG